MIEVFKTNVHDKVTAEHIIETISLQFPEVFINFDLEDHDRILRIESEGDALPVGDVITLMNTKGYECEVLED